jgi:hypothetical protein
MIDEQKLNRYSISLQDFSKAEGFLAEAKKHEYGGLAHEALVFTAIICYCRPFSPNEKKTKAGEPEAKASSSLNLDDFSALSPMELNIHERCIELRNKALAHAEFKYHPTSLDMDTGAISSTVFSLVGKVPDLDLLSRLIEALIEQCRNRKADYVFQVRS